MTTLFKPIRPKKLSEEIVAQIQARISDGQLKPGDRIPSERELASALGVSRPSVREAIMMLDAMGLLEARQGGGTYVRSLTESSLGSPLTEMIEKDPKLLNDLLEVRIGLECWSASLAATRANDDDLKIIGSYLEEMRKSGKYGWDPEVDSKFHYAIATATHNTIQLHVLNTVHGLFTATIELALHKFYSSRPDYIETLLNQHQAIYDNIAAHDTDGARNAMAEHLKWVQDKLPRILQEAAA
jgi:GntR family transcriptional repressor for pyruvate dehydrogenase complex